MFTLLDTFRQGSTYDDALQKVYGLDMDGLNTIWQASLKAPKTSASLSNEAPVLAGVSP